jgi:hypothetical protein
LGTLGALIANESTLPMGGPGTVAGGTPPTDTDRDGMPDAWEIANGLNPANAADGKIINADGYSNLERYVNGLVGPGCEAACEDIPLALSYIKQAI